MFMVVGSEDFPPGTRPASHPNTRCVVTNTMGFSLNEAKLSLSSVNLENLRNHWVQYHDLLC